MDFDETESALAGLFDSGAPEQDLQLLILHISDCPNLMPFLADLLVVNAWVRIARWRLAKGRIRTDADLRYKGEFSFTI